MSLYERTLHNTLELLIKAIKDDRPLQTRKEDAIRRAEKCLERLRKIKPI